MDLKDKIVLVTLLFVNLKIAAQLDTTFFKKNIFKINDTLIKESITVFEPDQGIDIGTELNKYFLRDRLIEENISMSGKLNGVSKKYYSNGKLKEISNYVLGSRVGLYCEFYENGRIKIIGEYFLKYNDSLVFLIKPNIESSFNANQKDNFKVVTVEYNQGHKNGRWLYFNVSGVLVKEEIWDNGILKK